MRTGRGIAEDLRIQPTLPSSRMHRLWSLGGLSPFELIRRTARESWEDAVFGQGGRMAFYQFLAFFPSIVVFLVIGEHIPHLIDYSRTALHDFSSQLFPEQVAQLLQNTLEQHNERTIEGSRLMFTVAGALWAALNATWAMIYGLNRAYEVTEDRPLWEMAVTIIGLTVAMALTGCIAVFVIFFSRQLQTGTVLARVIEWLVLLAAMSCVFALLYRFAVNVPDHEWRWSTPGAAVALLLWVAATFAARIYFGHINDYSRAYGHLNGVVMLLLWLYVTNGAILIGGEMNSEIEKAASHRAGNPQREVSR